MNHTFNVDVAAECGVEAAIIFENIQFWIAHRKANAEHIKDGYSWVYNSRAAWCELFPYLGEKQIRNAIERLLVANLIVRGNYSYGPMNRTYWYRLGERAKLFGRNAETKIGPNGQTKTAIDAAIGETASTPCIPQLEKEPAKKAPRRANPLTTLEQHLETSGGIPPAEWGEYAHHKFGWDADRISFEWDDFHNYWTGGNAKGSGRKADWTATWRGHCLRFAAQRNRGYGTSGKPRGATASVFASIVADKYGISRTGGGVGGGQPTSVPQPDTGGTRERLPVGEIPY